MPATPLVAPDFSKTTAYPEVAELLAALDAEDWPAVQRMFADLGWDGYTLLAWEAGAHKAAYGFLSGRASEEELEPLAGVLFASQLMQTGWRVRTDAPGSEVSQQQAASFHEHLRRADQLLEQVTTQDPDNAVAWELRLTIARGLELGLEEARRRYDQVMRVAPHHLTAQQQLLQLLAPKWGGSFEQMHAFARECAEAAPDGAPNGVLVVEAHLEHLLHLPAGERAVYLRNPDVWRDLQRAAARSVGHADYRRTYGWVGVHNLFALGFGLVGDVESAASQFTVIGHLADPCWSYVDDPVQTFNSYRWDSLRATGDAAAPAATAAATETATPGMVPGRPGIGSLITLIVLWSLAGLVLACGGVAVLLGMTDAEEYTRDDWEGSIGLLVIGLMLAVAAVLVGLWRRRQRRPRHPTGGS